MLTTDVSALFFASKRESFAAGSGIRNQFMKLTHVLVLIVFLVGPASFAEQSKYAPQTVVLSVDHDYLSHAAAPDFWALMPYYVPQVEESGCSIATVAMAVNGARAGIKLTSEDPLALQKDLVKKVKNKAWNKGFFGWLGYATSLDQLGEIVPEAFKAYGVTVKSVEVVHGELTDAIRTKLHQALVENEKSARDFILLNFDQKVFTGDMTAGHMAPVAAYDEVKKRVLVLDPDRTLYEPYWVTEEALLQAISTRDEGQGKTRGYVWVKF